MDRFEKSLESSIKVILEYLRRLGPEIERSEMELERETKEKVVNKVELLNRLRHNAKIGYNPITGKYRYKPVYSIRNRAELVELLGKRATLTIDQDLLDCYAGIEADVQRLLTEEAVWAVRNADMEKTIKCEKNKANKVKGAAKCSLYVRDRCGVCADNKGIVIMKKSLESGSSAPGKEAVKELWHSEMLPILSEVQRVMAGGGLAGSIGGEGDMTHLTMTSTQHMLTKSSIAKLKAAARMNQRQRKRTADGKLKTDGIANEHVLEHLTGANL